MSNSASGRWNLFIHAHQGMIEVSKTTGSSLLDDSGLSSSHFLLLTSEEVNQSRGFIRNKGRPQDYQEQEKMITKMMIIFRFHFLNHQILDCPKQKSTELGKGKCYENNKLQQQRNNYHNMRFSEALVTNWSA